MKTLSRGVYMLNAIEIGNRIQDRQKKLGLKQKDIIKMSGVSKAAISNYVNGNRIPDTEAVLKISIALKTTVEWILIGKSTNENYTDEEKQLLEAYRIAPPGIKEATKKLLDVKNIYSDDMGNFL